jgi:hypothetical protein
MALANGKITAPVSIDDLKNLFGEGSGDLATLCTSPKINVWAKYKPTVYPSPFLTTGIRRRMATTASTLR